MTPITQRPVQPVVVQSIGDAPGHIRAHLPNITLAALRIVAGLMLMQHGVQKHFGLLALPNTPAFTGGPEFLSPMWIAGTLEIGGGLLLALGLFTRPVAFVLSGLMAAAYFSVHAPQGFWPVQNGGELAALYCFVFLMFAAVGGSRYSLDHLRDAQGGADAGDAGRKRRTFRDARRRRRLREQRVEPPIDSRM